MRSAAKKTAVTVLGWFLLLVGVAALVLPGPGLLLILAGMVVLAGEYAWARRMVHPVRERAYDAAAQSVKSRARVLLGLVSALFVLGVGVLWFLDPVINVGGEVYRLPFGGWGSGVSLFVSGLVTLGILVFSYRRWGRSPDGR